MPDARPLKAIICDHDAWSIRTLNTVVSEAGFEILAEPTNAIDTIRMAELLGPTLVVITQEQNGLSGMEAIPDLRRGDEPPEVLLISIDDSGRVAAKEAGAFDLCVKGETDILRRQLSEVRELLETGERRASRDRRSGKERRQQQDWSKVTAERRSGTDRRGTYRREKDVTVSAKEAFRQQMGKAGDG